MSKKHKLCLLKHPCPDSCCMRAKKYWAFLSNTAEPSFVSVPICVFNNRWQAYKGLYSATIVSLFFFLMASTVNLFPTAMAGCVYLHSKFQQGNSNWYSFASWHKPSAPKQPRRPNVWICSATQQRAFINSQWHVTKLWRSLGSAQVGSRSRTARYLRWFFNIPQTRTWQSICGTYDPLRPRCKSDLLNCLVWRFDSPLELMPQSSYNT